MKKVVKANIDYVPPYGSGATLYIRPYMFGSNPVIIVKPANEYQFRVFRNSCRAFTSKEELNLLQFVYQILIVLHSWYRTYQSWFKLRNELHAIVDAHNQGSDENMYLDAATRTKVEETGGANFIFVTKR